MRRRAITMGRAIAPSAPPAQSGPGFMARGFACPHTARSPSITTNPRTSPCPAAHPGNQNSLGLASQLANQLRRGRRSPAGQRQSGELAPAATEQTPARSPTTIRNVTAQNGKCRPGPSRHSCSRGRHPPPNSNSSLCRPESEQN